jgi:hypothetical protein
MMRYKPISKAYQLKADLRRPYQRFYPPLDVERVEEQEVMTHEYLNHGSDQPPIYRIVLQGHLSSQWSDWFDGFIITLDADGQTILTGPIVDQAALHGVLKKIRDLGISLVSIQRMDPNEGATGQ